jgi:hypothetical protein
MHKISDKEACHLLSKEGFTELEIHRLIQLRRDYTASQTTPRHPRLQFIWWFLKTLLTHDIGYALSHLPLSNGRQHKVRQQSTKTTNMSHPEF